jgi:hypothetical protein
MSEFYHRTYTNSCVIFILITSKSIFWELFIYQLKEMITGKLLCACISSSLFSFSFFLFVLFRDFLNDFVNWNGYIIISNNKHKNIYVGCVEEKIVRKPLWPPFAWNDWGNYNNVINLSRKSRRFSKHIRPLNLQQVTRPNQSTSKQICHKFCSTNKYFASGCV